MCYGYENISTAASNAMPLKTRTASASINDILKNFLNNLNAQKVAYGNEHFETTKRYMQNFQDPVIGSRSKRSQWKSRRIHFADNQLDEPSRKIVNFPVPELDNAMKEN